jgi:hypothetical protein
MPLDMAEDDALVDVERRAVVRGAAVVEGVELVVVVRGARMRLLVVEVVVSSSVLEVVGSGARVSSRVTGALLVRSSEAVVAVVRTRAGLAVVEVSSASASSSSEVVGSGCRPVGGCQSSDEPP